MRLRGFLFFLGSLLTAEAFAQTDTLLAKYASYADDTNKVNLLYEKGFAYRNNDLPRAIQFAKACYACAEKIQDKHFLAKALNFTGILKSETGLHSAALADLQKALALRIETHDTLSQAIILNNLGNVYSELGDSAMALSCYERSLRTARSINNERWINGALYSMAELQTGLKMFPQAEGNLSTLIGWAQQKNDYEILGLCYKNMGICSMNRRDTLAAESYQQQALDVADMTDDDILKADAMTALGELYVMEKRSKEALVQLTGALAIFTRNEYREGLMRVWKTLADLYGRTDSHKLAFYYLQKHDSVLAIPRATVPDSLEKLWQVKKDDTVVLEKKNCSWKDNVFECIITVVLAALLIFVLMQRRHEQKE